MLGIAAAAMLSTFSLARLIPAAAGFFGAGTCVLIAGLVATGETAVITPSPTRDHTERMLRRAGVDVRCEDLRVVVGNVDELELERVEVPGDLSSAAFLVAAGVLVPGSRLVVENVGTNWSRAGFLRIAERMGAVAGLASRDGVEVIGMDAAAVSYPDFVDDMRALEALA